MNPLQAILHSTPAPNIFKSSVFESNLTWQCFPNSIYETWYKHSMPAFSADRCAEALVKIPPVTRKPNVLARFILFGENFMYNNNILLRQTLYVERVILRLLNMS